MRAQRGAEPQHGTLGSSEGRQHWSLANAARAVSPPHLLQLGGKCRDAPQNSQQLRCVRYPIGGSGASGEPVPLSSLYPTAAACENHPQQN